MNGECISFHLPAHMFFLNRSLGHHLVLGSQEPHCWVNLKLKYDRGRGTVEGINAGNVQTVASVDLPRGRSKGIGSRQRIEKGKGGGIASAVRGIGWGIRGCYYPHAPAKWVKIWLPVLSPYGGHRLHY